MSAAELPEAAAEIRILAAILTKTATRELEQRLHAAGVEVGGLQYGVLRVLQRGEQTISELSRRMRLDPSTLVPVVDALERKGLARRGQDPRDRRRMPIALTASGADLLARVPFLAAADSLVASLRQLGPAGQAQLLSLLRELIRGLPDGAEIVQTVSAALREPAKT